MSVENEPEAVFDEEPAPSNEPVDVTQKREAQKLKGAVECAEQGHAYYLHRNYCGRCFAPKPEWWQP